MKKILIKSTIGFTTIGAVGGAATATTTSCSKSATYSITPTTNVNNVINWDATKKVDGGEPITESGRVTLCNPEDNTTSFSVDFDGDIHTFEVNWVYTETEVFVKQYNNEKNEWMDSIQAMSWNNEEDVQSFVLTGDHINNPICFKDKDGAMVVDTSFHVTKIIIDETQIEYDVTDELWDIEYSKYDGKHEQYITYWPHIIHVDGLNFEDLEDQTEITIKTDVGYYIKGSYLY